MVIGQSGMTHEDFLTSLTNKLHSIQEEVLSVISILDVKVLKKKGQDNESRERVIKSLINFNDIEFNTIIDAYKVSAREVVVYADFDDCLELSCNATKYSGDNKSFIQAVKEKVLDINNGDLPSDNINIITEDILFKIQERIQEKVELKLTA